MKHFMTLSELQEIDVLAMTRIDTIRDFPQDQQDEDMYVDELQKLESLRSRITQHPNWKI